jgi:hypothetical protein
MFYIAHGLESGDRSTYARAANLELKVQDADKTLEKLEQEYQEDEDEIVRPDFFLSHHKAGAASCARLLKYLLRKITGSRQIFLDRCLFYNLFLV